MPADFKASVLAGTPNWRKSLTEGPSHRTNWFWRPTHHNSPLLSELELRVTAHAKNTFQDKGLVLVLQDLHAASPGQLRSKSSDEARGITVGLRWCCPLRLGSGSPRGTTIRCIWSRDSGGCH